MFSKSSTKLILISSFLTERCTLTLNNGFKCHSNWKSSLRSINNAKDIEDVLVSNQTNFSSAICTYSFPSSFHLQLPRKLNGVPNQVGLARSPSIQICTSRSTKKPTLWTLRKISTRITLSMPRRITRTHTLRLLWIFCFIESLLYTSIPLIQNVSARIYLRGLHRLISVDTVSSP